MPVRTRGRRYLGFWILGENNVRESEIDASIREGVLALYGTHGLSLVQPRLIEFNEEGQRGILRCDRDHLTETRAVLALITQIAGFDAAVFVEKASGTIRSLKKSFR